MWLKYREATGLVLGFAAEVCRRVPAVAWSLPHFCSLMVPVARAGLKMKDFDAFGLGESDAPLPPEAEHVAQPITPPGVGCEQR